MQYFAIQNPFQVESFKISCRTLYCEVKGWQYNSSAEFKHSELVIVLRVLEPSRRALLLR